MAGLGGGQNLELTAQWVFTHGGGALPLLAAVAAQVASVDAASGGISGSTDWRADLAQRGPARCTVPPASDEPSA